MGNKSQKKTNEMLAEQTRRANEAGDVFGGRSGQEYDYRTGLRGDITGKYWDLYNQAGADQGGGGGGGGPAPYDYLKDVRMNEAMGTARDLMNTGLWTPEQIAQSKSWSTAPISGLYAGIQNQLLRQRAGMGMPGTFGGGLGRLAREKAYEMGNIANQTSMDIERNIRENRIKGIGEVGGFDTEMMDRLERARAKVEAGRRAAAMARAGADNAARSEQASYLGRLTGLMGGAEDLPYAGLQLQGYGQGLSGVTSRVDETPTWQKMAMGLIPSAASAAMGAFGGSYGGRKKPQQSWVSPDYYNPEVEG